MLDIHNRFTQTTIHQKSLATAGALLGSTVIDTAGYRSLEIIATKAACTATTGTFIIDMESGTASTTTAHASATTSEVLGTNVATMTATTANSLRMGYVGADRYVSVAVTAGAATGAITIVAIRGHDMKQPAA